jgi:hypothetical protein
MEKRTGSWCFVAALAILSLSSGQAAAEVAPSVSAQVDSRDACRQVGEGRFGSADPSRCQGVWLVFASYSGGGIWWHDKDGTNPRARQLQRRALALQARLARCGIRAFVSLSDWFDRFTPGLMVVHSAPHATTALASRDLRLARRCGIAGFAKFSELQIVGRD